MKKYILIITLFSIIKAMEKGRVDTPPKKPRLTCDISSFDLSDLEKELESTEGASPLTSPTIATHKLLIRRVISIHRIKRSPLSTKESYPSLLQKKQSRSTETMKEYVIKEAPSQQETRHQSDLPWYTQPLFSRRPKIS